MLRAVHTHRGRLIVETDGESDDQATWRLREPGTATERIVRVRRRTTADDLHRAAEQAHAEGVEPRNIFDVLSAVPRTRRTRHGLRLGADSVFLLAEEVRGELVIDASRQYPTLQDAKDVVDREASRDRDLEW